MASCCIAYSPALARLQQQHAADILPPPLAEVVALTGPQMSARAIADLLPPCMSVGRVALIGEAALVSRPHGTTAVTKAAQDAVALADALKHKKFNVEKALKVWNMSQLNASYDMWQKNARIGNRLQGLDFV